MLAFHNEHIASCAFLTYFTPDSTTASTSPTALTTAAAATILNDKQALTGILMKPKCLTNFTKRLHPYDLKRQQGVSALKNFSEPLLQPLICQPLHSMPLEEQQHKDEIHHHAHTHQHHHPHSHHHNHHHHHLYKYRVFKDYIAHLQQMSSLILASNSEAKQRQQNEQHQFNSKITTLASITSTTRTAETATATPTTTSTATAATTTASRKCISPLKVYKHHTQHRQQQQHQYSHDYIQFNRNLSKL